MLLIDSHSDTYLDQISYKRAPNIRLTSWIQVMHNMASDSFWSHQDQWLIQVAFVIMKGELIESRLKHRLLFQGHFE
jgi:hypothetical protein